MNRRTAAGCTAGCSLVIVAILMLFMMGNKQLKTLVDLGGQFVEQASRGDLQQAYGLLHPNKQAELSFDQFAQQWSDARAELGPLQTITPGDKPGIDPERSVMILSLKLVGEKVTGDLQLDINPKDRPMKVVDYRLSGLPSAAASPADSADGTAADGEPGTEPHPNEPPPAAIVPATKDTDATTTPAEKDPQ